MAHSLRTKLKLKSNESSSSHHTTPVKSFVNSDDYSPVYLACTQESLENVDVLWDWNSPQSKLRGHRRPKRIINKKSSPKLPLKKHLKTTNTHRSFDKIHDELLAFQEEIKPGPFTNLDASELDIDPRVNNNQVQVQVAIDKQNNESIDDLFDDSLEQELLMVSQQIEEKVKQSEANKNLKPLAVSALQSPENKPTKTESPRTLTKSFSSNTLYDSPLRTPNRTSFDFKGKLQLLNMNDSFDVALGAFEEDFDIFPAAAGPAAQTPSPLKFKTKSLSFGHSYEKITNEHKMREEIERKRLAALAKLRSKKPAFATILSDSETSPIKCSPEEIEKKRQEALAKLEQKKQQELIERNRLEALKKLEMRRKNRRV